MGTARPPHPHPRDFARRPTLVPYLFLRGYSTAHLRSHNKYTDGSAIIGLIPRRLQPFGALVFVLRFYDQMFLAPLFPIMLHNLVQRVSGFTCAADNPVINGRARHFLVTTTCPRHVGYTSFRLRGKLFSSTSNDSSAIPITVLSGFLGR